MHMALAITYSFPFFPPLRRAASILFSINITTNVIFSRLVLSVIFPLPKLVRKLLHSDKIYCLLSVSVYRLHKTD